MLRQEYKSIFEVRFCFFYKSFFQVISLIIILFAFVVQCRNGKHENHSPASTTDGEGLFNKARIAYQSENSDSTLLLFRQAYTQLTNEAQWDKAARSLVFIAELYRKQGVYDSALILLENCLILAAEHPEITYSTQADCYHKKGVIYIDKGNYATAMDFLRKAIECRAPAIASGDSSDMFSYNSLGIIHLRMNNYDSSFAHFGKAIERARETGADKGTDFAMFLENKGIAFSMTGNYDSAAAYFKKAMQIYRYTYGPEDPRFGRVYLNLGRQLQLSGQADSALITFTLAENALKEKGTEYESLMGVLFMNMAAIHTERSDYEKALSYNNKALSIFSRLYTPNHPRIRFVLQNIGLIHEKKGQYHQAIEYYNQSLVDGEVSANSIKTLRNLGTSYLSLGDTMMAQNFLKKSLDMSYSVFKNPHPDQAFSHLSYARFLHNAKKYPEALKHYDHAESIFRSRYGLKNRDLSNVYTQKGNTYVESGNIEMGISYFQKAIEATTKGFKPSSYLEVPENDQLVPDHFLLNALYSKANALHRLFHKTGDAKILEYALTTYKRCSFLVNRIRSGYLSQESKLVITSVVSELYPKALDCSLDLYFDSFKQKYLDDAFVFSEEGKSALLLAALSEAGARESGILPKSFVTRERFLKQSLDAYNHLIAEENLKDRPNEDKLTLWHEKVFSISRQYDSLIEQISQEFPEYYLMRFGSGVITLQDVRKRIKPDELLVSYTTSDENLYVFVIRSDTAYCDQIAANESFSQNIEQLRQLISSSDHMRFTARETATFEKVANSLYETLLGSIRSFDGIQNVIIVPDNQLGYIPFEILVTRPTGYHKDFRTMNYFIRDYAISYSYSASVMFGKFGKQEKMLNKILAFAPEYSTKDDTLFRAFNGNVLLALPWAAKEVKTITGKFRGKAYIGRLASEKQFKQLAPKYKVLHLAMHTVVNNDNPLFSKMVFAPPTDSLEDGYLNTYELFSMDLNSDMAVLSACSTGDGTLFRGEGIMSLARGFFYAGVPSVIMTLWTAEDQSGSQLFSWFYEYLSQGYDKSQALQQAKLRFLEHSDQLKAHPYYWASYVVIGENSPLPIKRADRDFILLLAVLFIAGISVILVRRLLYRSR